MKHIIIKLLDEELIKIWGKGEKKISLNSLGVKFKGTSGDLFLPYVCIIYLLLIIFLGLI